jgi:RNA polymerase sigma-70 factor, ECF subfamily
MRATRLQARPAVVVPRCGDVPVTLGVARSSEQRSMSIEEISDEALMLRYQRGDRSAFGLLVRRHQVAVYNFLLRELGSALAADELAQEVFLGVVREGARYNYETRFSTRLFSIACRLVQHERSRTPVPGIAADERGGTARAETLEDSIVRAVDALPDLEKDVFLLREVADLPFSEIARVTQRTETAVKIQMQHALSRLRVALQDFDEYRRALR